MVLICFLVRRGFIKSVWVNDVDTARNLLLAVVIVMKRNGMMRRIRLKAMTTE